MMPFIRITCPEGAFTADQKEKLAASLAYGVMAQELDPVTENSIAAAPVVFDEIDIRNCFPGGRPLAQHPDRTFWIVEALVAAAFFDQARRDALQTAVARAFVEVLGDDGSEVVRGGLRISPAYLLRLYTVIVEIPEGSWGAGGRTIEIDQIGQILGADEGRERLAEAQENAAKLKAARVS
jgi:phenylpyruvate tautomerase PptA (4-oxalocrotonate tautomerase family)